MKTRNHSWALGCALAFGPGMVQAQTARPAAPAVVKTPPTFSLAVTPQRVVTLTAKDTKATDIGVSLAKSLGVPVRLSPMVSRQLVTLKLSQVPVERLFQALAPQVYIDYEVSWERPEETWVGVELTGFNEREPATPVEQKAFLVLAGSTEDDEVTGETIARELAKQDAEKLSAEAPAEGPLLDVSFKDGLVSIRARKQMVTAILLDVASKAGMGFDTRGELDPSIIDLDVRGVTVEQLPSVVARPGVALLMRRNLTAGSDRPVAMLLGSEASRAGKAPRR